MLRVPDDGDADAVRLRLQTLNIFVVFGAGHIVAVFVADAVDVAFDQPVDELAFVNIIYIVFAVYLIEL